MSWKYAHGTLKITGFGIDYSGGMLSIAPQNTQMANGLKTFINLL